MGLLLISVSARVPPQAALARQPARCRPVIKFGKDRIRGWDVARRARANNPALPVVYITGANAHEWAAQGVPQSLLLAKPFAPARPCLPVGPRSDPGPYF